VNLPITVVLNYHINCEDTRILLSIVFSHNLQFDLESCYNLTYGYHRIFHCCDCLI